MKCELTSNPKMGNTLLAFSLSIWGEAKHFTGAAEVAAESSTGTNFNVKTETPFSKEMNAIVYKIDQKEILSG